MPRPRATAVRKRRSIEVSDREFAYLSDDPDYESREGDQMAMLDLLYPTGGADKYKRTWDAVRDEILGWWPERHPGTRPRAWWTLEAPRWDDPWDDCWYHGTFAEPRRRLGGTGTPQHCALNYKPEFELGIPDSFIDSGTLAYYAEHGKNGGLENMDHPDEPVGAFDPDNPPQYESQARYLWDRDLLEPEERKAVEKLGLLDVVEVVQQRDDELEA